MPSAPVLALVLAILAGGLAILLSGAIGAFQWVRLSVRGDGVGRDGPARITGRARAREAVEPLVTPVSAKPSLCHEWALEHEVGRRARPVWRPIATGDARVVLAIDAGGGTVHVDPADASLALDVDETRTVESVADLPDGLPDRAAGALENGAEERYRVIERRLGPGDRVTATGVLSTADGQHRLRGPAVPRHVERLLAVPFVIADPSRDDGVGLVRDRAVAGFVLGLPPTLLSLVLLFPP